MIASNASLSCARCPGEATTEVSGAVPGSVPAPSLSPTGHLVVAVCLGCIGTLGFLSNFLVLALFCRYRALRTPMNLLLVSISVSDLLVSVLGTPFSFAASTQGRWLIGRAGCVWYGFINACLGIVSLISLAVLSYERYCTMMTPTMADGRDFRPALAGICFSWLYSVAWTVPPLLGWSRYGPEGPGTTCSVDWKTQTPNNVSYIVSLFTFCLALPFAVIVYSYGKLLFAIRRFHRCFRAFFSCSAPEPGSTLKTFSRPTKTFRSVRPQRDHQVTAPTPSTAPPTCGRASAANSGCSAAEPPSAAGPKPKVILVAHYRE
ncbi:teleost multiple tissue opsin b isoform X2 [Poecilia latipinna]|uniref:teleost multiple tissue opsin b isoform X2 n=1 Tax=Poecilia latipinna TaxID=48699 RepID=UPI00072ED18D|nr:PREDICTED: opsin-3-like isoform X2 [Poecilia latipinna]XP_016528702.1 PREDICTED: opsin-3-like isoform X2 [Poecilia formosa]